MKTVIIIAVVLLITAINAAPVSVKCSELYHYCNKVTTNTSQRIDHVDNLYNISDDILELLRNIYRKSNNKTVSTL